MRHDEIVKAEKRYMCLLILRRLLRNKHPATHVATEVLQVLGGGLLLGLLAGAEWHIVRHCRRIPGEDRAKECGER
jgi:hypothetical protein